MIRQKICTLYLGRAQVSSTVSVSDGGVIKFAVGGRERVAVDVVGKPAVGGGTGTTLLPLTCQRLRNGTTSDHQLVLRTAE